MKIHTKQGVSGRKKVNERAGAGTLTVLAGMVKRSVPTVHAWIHDDRWPFAPKPPWTADEVEQIKVWAAAYLRPGIESAEEIRLAAESRDGIKRPPSQAEQAKLAYLVERAMMMKQRRLVEAGKLHDVDACVQQRLKQIYEVKSRLLEMPRSMAISLVGMNSETIEKIIRKHVESIIAEFAGDMQENDEENRAENKTA